MGRAKWLENMTLDEHVKRNCTIDGDCWIWRGGANGSGFPQVWWRGKRFAIRRALKNLRKGRYASMSCGNPKCVAPDHIESVSKSEYTKARVLPPESLARQKAARRAAKDVKLGFEKAREIRRRVNDGELQASIARDFGVSRQTVTSIKQNDIWRETSPWAI